MLAVYIQEKLLSEGGVCMHSRRRVVVFKKKGSRHFVSSIVTPSSLRIRTASNISTISTRACLCLDTFIFFYSAVSATWDETLKRSRRSLHSSIKYRLTWAPSLNLWLSGFFFRTEHIIYISGSEWAPVYVCRCVEMQVWHRIYWCLTNWFILNRVGMIASDGVFTLQHPTLLKVPVSVLFTGGELCKVEHVA